MYVRSWTLCVKYPVNSVPLKYSFYPEDGPVNNYIWQITFVWPIIGRLNNRAQVILIKPTDCTAADRGSSGPIVCMLFRPEKMVGSIIRYLKRISRVLDVNERVHNKQYNKIIIMYIALFPFKRRHRTGQWYYSTQ